MPQFIGYPGGANMEKFVDERVFDADVKLLPEITSFICQFAEKSELHPKKLMHLELAVDEVVSNICHYAYIRPPGEIVVSLTRGEGSLCVSFIDEGVTFDPLTMEEPDIKADLFARDAGGLGIFLVRRVMDEVHYKNDGKKNILTLVLYTKACKDE
jgi:anti-sigma regulatory factor (Ser/Thr protein kinase)